jgi:hypothetical protein
MANAEGDDDVEDAEPQDNDNEAREMNDWNVETVKLCQGINDKFWKLF